MNIVFLSLGTNLGSKEHNLNTAIQEISKRIGSVTAQSDFIETEPWGFSSDNGFLNAAVKVETALTPFEVLNATQQIEQDMGRTEKSVNAEYHDRIIDIDILLYNDLSISTPTLTIPHPLMNERDFVLIPLNQIL